MHVPEASLFNTILIIFAMMGLLIIFFIIYMVRRHRRNIELYRSKIAAEINTLEKERARIAADLHDDVGPMLSAIKFKMGAVESDTDGIKLLKEAGRHIDEVIKKLRLISNNSLPPTLLRKGLVFAVEEYIQQIGNSNKMKINFTYTDIPVLETEQSVNLYRIIQEIVHNALKHSDAHNMKISLVASNNMLQLICLDNGRGFNHLKAHKDKTGLGLQNVGSRTELLHGALFIESEEGEGTYYSIELPINIK